MKDICVRPVDVLHLRGNRLFAESGHGEAVMPPWPSMFAGALRARVLVDRGVDFRLYRDAGAGDPEVRAVVGAFDGEAGSLRIVSVGLAAAVATEREREPVAKTYYPAPEDLIVHAEGERDDGRLAARALDPLDLGALGLKGSAPLPLSPVLRTPKPDKPERGIWISAAGLSAHLAGQPVPSSELVRSRALWKLDPRLGIALDTDRRTTSEGMLYTTQAVALTPGAGFRVRVAGAGELLPTSGALRLGGDARAAHVDTRVPSDRVDSYLEGRRLRLVLATPALSRQGWLPPGVREESGRFVLRTAGLTGVVVAAAVPRAETISGWQIGKGPKPAVRVVPAGAVYWLDEVEGSLAARQRLLDEGLIADANTDTDTELQQELERRRSEGFNNVWIGAWHAPRED